MANFRLSRLTLVTTAYAICLTTAISSLYGDDSVIRFVGPADRVQPPSANKAMASHYNPFKKYLSPAEHILTASANLDRQQKLIALTTAAQPQAIAYQATGQQKQLPQPSTDSEEVETPAGSTIENARCLQGPPLKQLSTNISLPTGTLPTDIAAQCAATNPPIGDQRLQAGWAVTYHHWSATGMYHRPLYFEEINAERYGYTSSYCLQPIISAGRFFATIPALPYKMAVDCPRSCQYTLGHYRPGSCVPRRANRLPLSAKGTAAQVGIVAGLILLIP